jgi:hypothetical protein
MCRRLNYELGDKDWYEDHGPNLRAAGLPWFYYYPSPELLTPQLREKYIGESELVWGKEHWIPTKMEQLD